MSLKERLIEAAMKPELNDYDQRSALGMARTWIERGIKPEWNPNQIHLEKRDDLAKELVTILDGSGAEPEEMILALREVRAEVNKPFQVADFERRAKQKGEYGKSKQPREAEN